MHLMLTIYTFTDNTRYTKSASSFKPTKPILYYTKIYMTNDSRHHSIHFNHKDIEITEKHVKTLKLLNGQS